ncbi:DNA-directed RNA polymerases II 24 kDa polypeptide (RNA polymerase II subunit 5) [Curvularia kusanoi]|uniref:DNA-directed RNA polymerases I, II, and III subunit RPABC1 n=1 Tax=Curvularia kusanoi TaxID=90978 RepID=A0A9P4WEW4_CURKU|nr:DNA-directed RNA polymerases II 24 kDa polypeptide (RNA polymerase II subunit 5) [Curvularia kusanoi]
MSDERQTSAELIRIWRAWRTAKEMMHDRGYQVLEEDMAMSLDEFASKFARADGEPDRSRLHFSCQPSEEMLAKYTPVATKKDPEPRPQIGTIWVEFNNDDGLGTPQIKKFVEHLVKYNFYSGTIITVKPMTTMAHRYLRNSGPLSDGPKGGVEAFTEQDLMVNITKHELVPKHVLLSEEEKQQLLKRYRLKATQLPRIQAHDPVAKYLGLKKGAVVKIIRKSETAGRYASYRWVI